MAVGLKRDAIPGSDTGGNKLILAECTIANNTVTFATLAAGTTCVDVGSIASSDVDIAPNKTEKKSEDGEVQRSTFTFTRMTKGVLMQEDKYLLDFLGTTVRNKTHCEFKYLGYVNSLHQWYIKFVEVTPQHNIKRSAENSNLNYESTGVKIPASVTISATTLASISALLSLSNFPTTAVTVPVVAGYYINEA